MTEIGALLDEAMRRKREDVPDYGYRELGRDSDVHFTYAQKVVKGTRHPSRDMLRAWSRALDPYLPLDKALVAAGYMPEERSLQEKVRDAVGLAGRTWRRHLPIQHGGQQLPEPARRDGTEEEGDGEPEV